MYFPTGSTSHPTAYDGPVVDHWLKWRIAQTVNASVVQDRSAMQEDPSIYSRVLYRLSYDSPPFSHILYTINIIWIDACV